jgi:5-methyltetrahydrofolate--homocysteine methyltransferase
MAKKVNAKKRFLDLIKKGVVVLDGSTGVAMQRRGMPNGVCPEKWALDNPKHLIDLQKEYVKAGTQILYTFTLGATRPKLDEFGLGKDVLKLNEGLAKISRKALGKNGLVAGDIGPTGHFPKPFGDMPFETCVNHFKEQAKGLLKGGVDLFVIETMIDIQEARAALLACKELSDKPVIVSMTFDKDMRTLTGTDPVTALITLQSLGADVVGVNCSTGPAEMVKVIEMMKPYAKVPLMAKPNAGLPRLVDGKTIFDMDAKTFSSYTKPFVKAGVNLLGGCCGTSPECISGITAQLKTAKTPKDTKISYSAVTSARKTVFMSQDIPVVVVGERINPTGKKQLQEELKAGKTEEVRKFAFEQAQQGARILDVNVGMPGITEKDVMVKTVEMLSSLSELPLCIDSPSPDVIEAALRIYPGRALINSISGEPEKMKKLLPIAAKYGAMFVLLPLGGKGVPETAKKRQVIIDKVFTAAKKFGFTNKDIIIDGLVMTVSANQEAAAETLKLISRSSKDGFNTIVGLSNVSFGLPERGYVNSAFLAMAMDRGLTMAIANPSLDLLMNIKAAADVLTMKDKKSEMYVKLFSGHAQSSGLKTPGTAGPETIYDAVVNGNSESIRALIEQAVKAGEKPSDIVDKKLIPAISYVGDLYEKKTYFLPQLIASADAMKAAFSIIEPLLKAEPGVKIEKKIVLIATVKGDIHDIGKNIVALMLKNYGFDVIDLGKDVHEFTIIEKVRETGARIVALSALMTTTMIEMKTVISLAKKQGLNCRFMIGGAVVTESYAREIGADGYSKDAYDAVKLAKKLSEN